MLVKIKARDLLAFPPEQLEAQLTDYRHVLVFDNGEELDPLFDQAVNFVTQKRKATISGVQRQFRIGYNRAARIIEQMEAQGIVSGQEHNGNREVLAPPPFD